MQEIKHFDWSTHYLDFYHKQSFHKHTKFIWLLYNLSHQMFLATEGECKFIFHSLLSDSLQCNGGSKTLFEILNRFGLLASFNTAKDEMKNVTSNKLLSMFQDEIVENCWAIVSLDNLDFDKPYACLNCESVVNMLPHFKVSFPSQMIYNM